jgi:catechol-2,3-dioxygenase
MDPEQNGTPTSGALLQVRDLSRLKAFYRDTLKLGAPAVDSNFWVEFCLPGNSMLVLEQTNAASETTVKGDICWLLRVEDLDAMVGQLAEVNVRPLRPKRSVPGRDCATFADPEGNQFTLYADTEASDAG